MSNDVLFILTVVFGVVGLIGTLYGMLAPWFKERREYKQRLIERDAYLRQHREREKK